MLEGISKATGVVPAVNQIEAHPLLPQDDLLAYMNNKGIHVTAYSPLGNNLANQTKIVDYPAVKEIAKRANVDEAQVLVAWGVKRGYSVIPKSVTPSRIESNFQQIELSDSDYQAVTDLLKQGKHTRFNIAHTYETPWDINIFGEPEEQKAKYTVKIA